jgi:glycine hydroxymethyltransferase
MANDPMSDPTISFEEVVRAAWEEPPDRLADLVGSLTDAHNSWHDHSINLVASHNVISPRAKAILCSDLVENISSGAIGSRPHTGTVLIDRIETMLMEMAKKLWGVPYVEYRAPSGNLANGLFMLGAMDHGDRVIGLSEKYGGHYSYSDSFASERSLEWTEIPCYGDEIPEINLELLADEVDRVKPKWLMVGSATSMFPYPLREMSDIADSVGARIFFDGAHFLGLSAGGQFQNPLGEGATVMTGSTQKTLPGPVGGMILMRDEDVAKRVVDKTDAFISNYNNNRTAALVVTLAEMMAFGKEYAAKVVSNAQALARALDAEGFSVQGKDRGFTTSHVVVVDLRAVMGSTEAVRDLETARISCSKAGWPATYPDRPGLRLGASASTRRGMGDEEMKQVARLLRRVLLDREDPTLVRRDVQEMAAAFTGVRFCF